MLRTAGAHASAPIRDESVAARITAVMLQLAPVRSSVHIPLATLRAHYQGGDVEAGLADLAAPAGTLIDDLLWWTAALKTARGLKGSSRS